MDLYLIGNTLLLVTDKPGERTFPMSPEDKTAVKLMIAALDAYGRARKNVSGLGWAAMMGWVDKKHRPILLFDDIENLTAQMLEVTNHIRPC